MAMVSLNRPIPIDTDKNNSTNAIFLVVCDKILFHEYQTHWYWY